MSNTYFNKDLINGIKKGGKRFAIASIVGILVMTSGCSHKNNDKKGVDGSKNVSELDKKNNFKNLFNNNIDRVKDRYGNNFSFYSKALKTLPKYEDDKNCNSYLTDINTILKQMYELTTVSYILAINGVNCEDYDNISYVFYEKQNNIWSKEQTYVDVHYNGKSKKYVISEDDAMTFRMADDKILGEQGCEEFSNRIDDIRKSGKMDLEESNDSIRFYVTNDIENKNIEGSNYKVRIKKC